MPRAERNSPLRAETRRQMGRTHGFFLCFDLTKRATFESLAAWLTEIRQYGPEGAAVMLVGLKADLRSLRQVSASEARQFAASAELPYVECSSRTGEGVRPACVSLAKHLVRNKRGELPQRGKQGSCPTQRGAAQARPAHLLGRFMQGRLLRI